MQRQMLGPAPRLPALPAMLGAKPSACGIGGFSGRQSASASVAATASAASAAAPATTSGCSTSAASIGTRRSSPAIGSSAHRTIGLARSASKLPGRRELVVVASGPAGGMAAGGHGGGGKQVRGCRRQSCDPCALAWAGTPKHACVVPSSQSMHACVHGTQPNSLIEKVLVGTAILYIGLVVLLPFANVFVQVRGSGTPLCPGP
jgi:hypothetical protein